MKRHLLTVLLMLITALAPLTAQTTDDDAARRQEEREAYSEARRLNTVEAWDVFINNYPHSYYMEQARLSRDAAVVNAYCNESSTLEQLVGYIDNTEAHDPRIKLFYANLVNNPTHSYRLEHLDVGFNGCTGRVDETVQVVGEKKPRKCYFVFNEQGLLTESSVMGRSGRSTVTRYHYSYDNLHGYALKQSSRKGLTVNYAPIYGKDDRLHMLKGSNDSRQTYSYGENGQLEKLTVSNKNSLTTLLYNDGYIIRMERGGKVYRYLYDFDSATGKKYLIAIRELKDGATVHERTFTYQIDTRGRITRCEVQRDGNPEMTVTRTYR